MKTVDALDELRELAWAFRASRVLQLAHKLDIFTLLSRGALEAGDIAAHCDSDPDMTERLLIACCALGLLESRDDRYDNTPLAEEYLVRDKPLYQGNWVAHMEGLWDYWGEQLEGELGGRDTLDPDGHRRFIMAMHDMAVAGEADELARGVDLEGRKKLLDVGGGPGTYSIYLCKLYPALRATLFDLPETIVIAREVVEDSGMSGRISFLEGDWNKDGFGSGHDAVLMSNVLHGEGSRAGMKLGKAYEALVPGGIIIIRDFVLNNAKTGPIQPALFNLMLGAYSTKEMEALIEEAGFVNVRALDVHQGSHSVFIALKP